MGSAFVLDERELAGAPPRLPAASFELAVPKRGDGDKGVIRKYQLSDGEPLDCEDKDVLSFEGFVCPWYKQLLFLSLGFASLGFLFLLSKWLLRLRVALRLSRCPLRQATHVRVTLRDGSVSLHEVCLLAPPVAAVPHGSTPLLPEQQQQQQQQHLLLPAGSQAGVLAPPQRLLEFRCGRYFYADGPDTFLPVPMVPRAFNARLAASSTALSATSDPRALEEPTWRLSERGGRYGPNEMAIPVRSVAALIADEMWHPFYVFQYFSIIIWVAGDSYITYAVCIFAITWFSIITSALETHANARRLADIAHFTCMVEVLRGGVFRPLPSTALVPGDVVAVVPGTLPADCVLLTGECIVDENMLTGESVPVRKVPYSPFVEGSGYDPDKHSSCTLYGGTQVAQARAPGGVCSGAACVGLGLSSTASSGGTALAVVVRTRFYSAKGQLLRSILHPRDAGKGFISDSLLFIGVMLVACMGIFVWAAVVLVQVGAEPSRIVVRFFDMITIAVPPALPACLTIATVFSIGRLRKSGIYVTGPHTITLAGQLDVVAFDKTGTLTVQGLELQSIVPVRRGRFEPPSRDMGELAPDVARLLATCHGLARLGTSLVGDPLDQKLFAASGWSLADVSEGGASPLAVEAAGSGGSHGPGPGRHVLARAHPPGQPGAAAAIVRRFEFSSELQRNVVVVRLPGGGDLFAASDATGPASMAAGVLGSACGLGAAELELAPLQQQQQHQQQQQQHQQHQQQQQQQQGSYVVYAKGSPEAIRGLVQSASVPPDFDAVLSGFTAEGLRVLALARGSAADGAGCRLDEAGLLRAPQEEVEAGAALELVGLAVLANPLRSDSAGAIAALQAAGVRTAMVTGDHVRTAVSVAHRCGILREGRPVLLMDGAAAAAPAAAAAAAGAAAGAPQGGPTPAPAAAGGNGVSLSVLYPDGSVNGRVMRSTVLPQVMMGELECAVTGRGFDALLTQPYDMDLLQPALRRGGVFARMSPDNKRDLMDLLGSGLAAAGPGCPHLGLHVGFCGDGANDCGALKAAHVGVSLCEAEASVAAPMTSRTQSITAMIRVIAEGRCALLATYQIFQFIVGYAMAQAFATNLMYTHALQMGNYQYLIQDLFYITILAALMGYTRPREGLARSKPVGRVLSLPLIASLLLQIAVIVVFQLAALSALRRVPWYTPTMGTPNLRTYVAPETSVIYLVNLSQFVILAAIFNKGYPHRQPLWTNWGLSAAMVLQLLFLVYSLFSVDAFTTRVQTLVGTQPPDGLPYAFRVGLLALMAVNAVAAVGAELLCGALLRLAGRARGAAWLRRRGSFTDPALRQGLLRPAVAVSGKPAPSQPGHLHVPVLSTPSGAALL